jgi:RsiW-degrading membrane proteinase PrsW (M82 family)
MILEAIVTNVALSILLLVIIYLLDRQEKEPPLVVARVYLLSILATWAFGRLKLLLGVPVFSDIGPAFDAFVTAALLEETLKLGLFLALAWRLESFDEEMDGIVYAMVVAAGFAVMENVYYALHAASEAAALTGRYHGALLRILILRAVPGHMLFAIAGGYCLGRARFAPRGRGAWILTGWAIAVVLHGTWNVLAWRDIRPFLAFALGLVAVAGSILVLAQRRTRYHLLQQDLRRRLRDRLALPAARLDAELRGALVAAEAGLRHLRGLEGREQDELAAWIGTRLLPLATPAGEDPGADGGLAGLREIAAALEARRDRFSAGLLAVFALLMIVPSSVLILTLMLL